jgi:DNA-binding transcriptional regulator YiaG
MKTLGDMFQHAVCACRISGDEILELFVSTGLAAEFEKGNPKYIAGRSGAELFCDVLEAAEKPFPPATLRMFFSKTPEYWCGWILGYYQWRYDAKFADIHAKLSFSELLALYPTLHEADMKKAAEIISARLNPTPHPTKLQTIRKSRQLSQQVLSTLSGVSLRSVQMYEQRNKDINKAQADTLYALAKILGCSIEDLLE